ncbi:MAG: DUF3857 domain-containing protein [Bacteroidales bacterium]|nr:DUF3857 domain-containing protein [Bacteroidales bacterium]
MRYRLIVPLLLWAGLLSAQEKYNAVVLADEESFTMTSATSGTFTVLRSVRVFNDAGLEDAEFNEYTDQFRSLTSFKGTIEKEGAKPVKIKKDDLVTVSVASGLAEDGFINAYQPTASYPFTVTYEYTMSFHKGFASFPALFPVTGEKVKVEKASYTVQVPSGTEIRYIAAKAGEPSQKSGKVDTYRWDFPVFEGYADEALMPTWREIVPFVMVGPVNFTYAGVSGSQGSWEDVGAWCYGLKQGTEDLPADVVTRLKAMTADAGSDLEKVRILYDYLREHTRYVSIQLGIGGYKPFPASQVNKTGFGDCKGLSNYMQAMLDAVGIPSSYTLVNTNRSQFLPGFAGIGQMNHVMLCVPLPEKKDTLWLECTNPSVPLGYRHEDVAGHDVVLVTADGGIPHRVPAYADSLSRDFRELEVLLEADGSAKVSVRRSLYLDETERWVSIRDWKPETQRSKLTSGLTVQPQSFVLTGVKDNFRDYDGPGYCPWMQVDYTFDTRQYATGGKDRLFVPVNPYPMGANLQRSKRQNDLVCRHGSVTRERISIRIPAGYTVESLPNPVSLDTEWGTFTASAQEQDGMVTILQELRFKQFREGPDHYDSFRTFIRAINKAYSSNIVLVSK